MDAHEAAAVLDRMARGDATALAELYDRHAGLVLGLALRIVRDRADAEDVVQEVFVQAWRTAGRYERRRGSPEAWLSVMARTRALDRLRRRAARREEPDDAAPADTATPPLDEQLAIRDALQALSADQRQALELAFYEGLTHSEIAARLDQPLGTVKTRIRTAMMRLRDRLDPE